MDNCDTPFSGSWKKGPKYCSMKCKRAIQTGFGKAREEDYGHMMEHVIKMLTMVDSGIITKPERPIMPACVFMPHGGAQLGGQQSYHGHAATLQRQKIYKEHLEAAGNDPEKYSRYIAIPETGQNLAKRKIEVRVMMEEEDENGEPTGGTFLHCFEGEVVEVRQNTRDNSQKFGTVTSRFDVAKVQWDVEFHAFERVCYVPLDPGLYGNEKRNLGWNILSNDYVDVVAQAQQAAR